MKKILFVLLIAVLVFSGLSCTAQNEVADYANSLNLPPGVVETMSPLGKSGMDENEKALVDRIYFLPQEVQASEIVINLLSEIAQDTAVTSEELDRFKDLDQDGLNNQWELTSYKTDPLEADSDHDGLDDSEEIFTYKTDPLNPDSDEDLLKDGEEILTFHTDPLNSDSDFDRLNDGEEVLTYKSDPLDKDDPLNKDSDGDGVIDYDDPEPLKANSYKETVSWLSAEMKADALACIIEEDKVQTFMNLFEKVYENVPHGAGRGANINAYPNAKWPAFAEWAAFDGRKHPRDILMNYYSYHQKVQLPPDYDDISCVYDIMADYIIEQTGWDEEGEKQGNNGVDCDVFPCKLGGYVHSLCIINVNGIEYLADPMRYTLLRLGQDSRYKFPWEAGWYYPDADRFLMAKFDKRFVGSTYDQYVKYAGCSWELLRNQTPENEEKLEALYLKIAYQGD